MKSEKAIKLKFKVNNLKFNHRLWITTKSIQDRLNFILKMWDISI